MRCGDAIAIVRFSFSRTLYMYTDTDTDTYTHIHRQTEAEANEKHSHIEPCVSSETNVTERYLLWPNEWIESERDIDARRTQNECWHLRSCTTHVLELCSLQGAAALVILCFDAFGGTLSHCESISLSRSYPYRRIHVGKHAFFYASVISLYSAPKMYV